jgi:DNA polymerase family A
MSNQSDILKDAADLLSSLGIEDGEMGELVEKAATKARRGATPYRYMKVLEFNPDSTDQVQELARYLKVKLPRRKDSDDEDALSTEKKYLKQAAKKHPVFGIILECRERNKMLSTYNWVLDTFNRVHTTIGHHPSTWRKSSRDYNLQNIPKRSDLATEFRRMVVAPPGHCIVEADSSAIEAVLVGYFARSPRYITLAKCGIHDWFNGVVHGESFSPDLPFDELKAQCKLAKARYPKESREVAKRTIHLTAYYGTPIRMNDEYPNEFPTVGIARKLQNQLLATPPGEDLQRWWHETHARANHDKFLTSPFGGRHRFFHIFKYNSRTQQWEPKGDDAKRCIAYLPQHSASMIQDIYVDALWKGPVAPYMRLPIHDSVLTVAPASEAPDVARAMFNTFQMPIEELEGLTIGAEVSASGEGGNWAPRSEDNPLGMETWQP